MSIENKVLSRIYGHGRGWAFSQIDFLDLGIRSTIDWILYKIEKRQTISKVLRGIYYYPQQSSFLNEEMPVDIPKVAQALARKFRWEILPSGETALNILGLSTQIPSKYVYITNGRSKTYHIKNRELQLKKGMLRETNFKYHESEYLVQALRALGKDNITSETIKIFRSAIEPSKYLSIKKDTKSVTGWIFSYIQEICS